ncbi:hypothetical protein O181_026093 [Austropuccinia psidii MF-1]|uniref:Uncharacterized protein n=1 Tax=Austropuccinia psidii MF-1 TaxID=1389203 RepID=A0A9Q3CLW1_9BASI|nr:hypothetical protein [Austropuccinia psidii MF-1]
MTQTLTYHSIQNVGRGIGPYAQAHPPAPTLTDAQTHAYTPATAHAPPHAHANATTLHPRYCAVGSTSVIRKMTIPQRQSPFMDDLVRSNPPLHQDLLKDLFDVCVWKQVGLV